MKQSPFNPPKQIRCAVLLIPLFFMGCFSSQTSNSQSNKRELTSVASIGRFFTFGRTDISNPSKVNAVPRDELIIPAGVSDFADYAGDDSELDIATPVSVGKAQIASWSASQTANPFFASNRLYERRNGSSNPGTAAKLIFGDSFSQLFSTVFGLNRSGDLSLAESDIANPFTEAKQKVEAATAASNTVENPKSPASNQAPNQDASNPGSSDNAGAGSGIRNESAFIIIGDFDGTGTVSSRIATRTGDSSFTFSGGNLDFNLFINPAAVELERSFCIDDLNGDDIPDLLTTNRSALFGSVYLGNGHGGFSYLDRFLTGYETIIPAMGRFHKGKREILAVNSFSGIASTFRWGERGYQIAQRETLPLVPNYLLHLLSVETLKDFLMAGQMGGIHSILSWNDEGRLEPTAVTLPAEPIVLRTQFGTNALKVYQVGSYASLVMTNNQGHSFNVANLRVYPGIFLIVGDLKQQGSTDVAIACPTLSNPN
jgi:hypothetical protein